MIQGVQHKQSHRALAWYLLLGLCLFIGYLPTLAPGVTFSDGPEVVTGVWTLGVIHPTGYPLFTMLAHGFVTMLDLPLAPAFELEVFNALCAAAAAVFTALAARQMALSLAQRRPDEPAYVVHPTRDEAIAADVAGMLAGALLGFSPLLWKALTIPEVYAFHELLVCWAGYHWISFAVTRRRRHVLGAAWVMGMGLAHHVTMVYMLPAAALLLLTICPSMFVSWLWWPLQRSAQLVGWKLPRLRAPWLFPLSCLLGFIPLLSYGYLLWANEHTTGLPWGDVKDWEHLVKHATGAQYRGFLTAKDAAHYIDRLRKLPLAFDLEFLAPGTAMFLLGAVVAFRRSWRVAVFVVAYLALNVAHGIYYSVGDYKFYFLPGLLPCCILIAAGAWWTFTTLYRCAPPLRPRACVLASGMLVSAAAICIYSYATLTSRVPPLATHLPLPMLVVGVLLATASALPALRRAGKRHRLSAIALPMIVIGGASLGLLPLAVARGFSISERSIAGESYALEIADRVEPGALFLTEGDGYLFTMWYVSHVLGKGRDIALIDLANVYKPWYRRYLDNRYPAPCDPSWGEVTKDPKLERVCSDDRARFELEQNSSWVDLNIARGGGTRMGDTHRGEVVRGADPRCSDAAFKKKHKDDKCRCHDHGRKRESIDGYCVFSYEENGYVPRHNKHIRAHRMIEDHIDERPVYERNALTKWIGNVDTNPRGWSGPAYSRLSAGYAFINRGRFNEIVYARQIASVQACSDTLQPIRPRKLRRPRRNRRRRRTYQPNPHPMLVHASYLTRDPQHEEQDATRLFHSGDTIHVTTSWFERFDHDIIAANKRGSPMRHGLRLCVFDPDGLRVAVMHTISNANVQRPSWTTASNVPAGRYTLRACDLGEVGDSTVAALAELPCDRLILEYPFELSAR